MYNGTNGEKKLSNKIIMESLKPLKEWIEGNSEKIDKNMAVELIDITGEICQDVIKQCEEALSKTIKEQTERRN